MMKSFKWTAIAFSLILFLTGQSAFAQDPVLGVLEACETEIKTHCADVTPGDGRILSCMYAYEDKLSDGCSASIIDLADAIDYMFANARAAIAICAPDIEANCSSVEVGGGRVLSCLKENSSKVSAECKPVVDAFAEQYGLTD